MQLNFLAPVGRTGYGICGSNLLAGLVQEGAEVALFPRDLPEVSPNLARTIWEAFGRQAFYNPSAPSVRLGQQLHLAEHVGHGLHCGFPIFELDKFSPSEWHHLNCQDRLLVCSAWARQVLVQQGMAEQKIRLVRLGVDCSVFKPAQNSSPRQTSTTFLHVGKLEHRKAQDFLLKAFNLAFEATDDVKLHMHGPNPQVSSAEKAEWLQQIRTCKLANKINFSDQPFASQEELAAWMSQFDCGVFPARAEGWNLELLEMMALAKPVIATNYSGHTEFANASNCRLIHVAAREPAQDGKAFRGQGGWAVLGEEQLAQLIDHLRYIHALKQQGMLLPNEAGVTTAQRLSWRNSARELLAAIC